jgi:hypothetical protein
MAKVWVLGIVALAVVAAALAAAAQLGSGHGGREYYISGVEGDVVKFIDPRTGEEVARVAAPFADSSVKLFEARLENDTLVLVDPGSGGEVARVKVRFVESVRVDRVDRVPEVPAPAGVKYYRVKLVGDQLLVIDEVANETFVSKIVEVLPPGVMVERGPEPTIVRVVVPISGTLAPSSARSYGPYSGVLAMQFDVSWSPASNVCVGYVDAYTWIGRLACTFGTRISTQFPVDPSQTVYAVVYNQGSAAVTYSGALTLYYQ